MAGSDVSRSVYRGLLLMDPRVTSVVASGDATYSTSYTQAGEHFDVPVPSEAADDLVLESDGTVTPEVTGQTFTIQTKRAGFPGRGKGSFLWKRSTDNSLFGHEFPNVNAAWESIVWTTGGASPFLNKQADAVTCSDGTVVVCVTQSVSPATTTRVGTYARSPSADTWGSAVTVHSASGALNFHPCMVVLPDDRILLFHWVADTAASKANVRAWVSDDKGASWSLYTQFALEDSIDTSTYALGASAGRLRAVYHNGDILLLGFIQSAAPVSYIVQWASADLGGSFQLVEALTTNQGYTHQDCTTTDGLIVIGMLETSGDQGIDVVRLGSAWQPISAASVIDINPPAGLDMAGTGANPAGDLALWTDEDGVVYAAGVIQDTGSGNGEGVIWMSLDAGLTWENVGESPLGTTFGTWYRTSAAQPSYPKQIAATYQRGRQVIFGQWADNGSSAQDSLAAWYLGGYSTLTNPFLDAFQKRTQQVGFDETWFPIELPQNVATWTRTTSGTASATLTSGYLELATTNPGTEYYDAVPATTPSAGLILQWEMQVTAGGSVAASEVIVRATMGDASHGFQVTVRFSTTQIRAYDGIAGSAIGAAVNVDMTQWVQFRLYMQGASGATSAGMALYYRVGSTQNDRAWTLAYSTSSLSDSGGSADQVRWGHVANTTSTTRWRQMHYTDGSNTGTQMDQIATLTGQDNPGDIHGKSYSTSFYAVTDGLRIRATDGPTYASSQWTIGSHYDYAIEKILPTVEPSPDEHWRSTVDNANYRIDFELSEYGDTEPLNFVIGLYMQGHNFPVFTWRKYDGGAWANLVSCDIPTVTGLISLRYVNNNGALRPGPGAQAGSHYFERNELAGGHIRFVGSTQYRTIVGNTEGFWQGTTTGKTKECTIWYEADGTEPASGTDLSIVPPQVLVLAHIGAVNYQAYRLDIAANDTADGYYKIGKVVMGPVAIFGKDSDWTRKYNLEPVTTVIENANGNRRTRRMARPRRSVELPWTTGIDTTQISGASAVGSADYLVGTSTAGNLAIGLRNDTASQLAGILDYTGGAHLPVVYCPRIPKGTPDENIFVQRQLSMYGRIVSDWSAEVVVGDEWTDELVRVTGLTLEEEL